MPATTAQKLKIKDGITIRTINAPADYLNSLGPLPEGVKVGATTKAFTQLHWFVKDRVQLEEELSAVLPLVTEGVTCWIFYPKGTSKIQTDLTRDKGWDSLLRHGMQWLSLISFDCTWSAFGMRQKTDKYKKKEAEPKGREIFKYIDAQKKIVYLPEDLEAALGKHDQQHTFFNTLSFTNRKEYVEWVVSAKKPETRATRVAETIERLGKAWKNPANR